MKYKVKIEKASDHFDSNIKYKEIENIQDLVDIIEENNCDIILTTTSEDDCFLKIIIYDDYVE
jgi:hypothetical protein